MKTISGSGGGGGCSCPWRLHFTNTLMAEIPLKTDGYIFVTNPKKTTEKCLLGDLDWPLIRSRTNCKGFQFLFCVSSTVSFVHKKKPQVQQPKVSGQEDSDFPAFPLFTVSLHRPQWKDSLLKKDEWPAGRCLHSGFYLISGPLTLLILVTHAHDHCVPRHSDSRLNSNSCYIQRSI